ncbi:Uncharacterised protein [Porphyromonas macacae]|uniref:DUF4827 domain-containing protein n=1 Tax=Porphyromonas macacae TaxID=28115 RepID=A0A379EAD4_9PORP|nr:DUF4827 family protein [Porphyromonas macacae]SUB89635.1 Uncharacterised protein [Porphyromonas macacae]
MNKRTFISLLSMILLVGITFSSCRDSKYKSLSELKRDQKKAIERFIKEKKISVVELGDTKLPDPYNKDVYYKFPNGLYMKIIDPGKTKPEVDKTHVFLKFAGQLFLDKVYLEFNSIANPRYQPTEFIYRNYYLAGEIHYSLVQLGIPGYSLDELMCEGLAYPMAHLGEGARVSLIVPFTLGSSTYYKMGYPMYIEEAYYTFKK